MHIQILGKSVTTNIRIACVNADKKTLKMKQPKFIKMVKISLIFHLKRTKFGWIENAWRLEQKLLFDCTIYWYDIVISGIDRSESHKYLIYQNERFRFPLERESSLWWCRNFYLH